MAKTVLLQTKAVVFDVFGTLAEIGQKRRPYGKLMEHVRATGRRPRPDDATRIMTSAVGLAGVAELFRVNLPMAAIAGAERDLHAELMSIRLYPEVIAVLEKLRASGYKIGLCSNLAMPYAVSVKNLLPFPLDAYAWSFECGAVKPEAKIYSTICAALGCHPAETLMVGDTPEADIAGARNFSMQALLLDRSGKTDTDGSITSLEQIVPLLT